MKLDDLVVSKNTTPQWGTTEWARERYGADFLRSWRWYTPADFVALYL